MKKVNIMVIVVLIIIVATIAFLIGKYGMPSFGPQGLEWDNNEKTQIESKGNLILEWNSSGNDAKPIINQINNKMNESYNKLIIKYDPKKGIKLPAQKEVEEHFKSKFPNQLMIYKSIYDKDK